MYLFRKSNLQKLNGDVEEIYKCLSFGLEVLQLNDSQRIQNDITGIKAILNLIKTNQTQTSLIG